MRDLAHRTFASSYRCFGFFRFQPGVISRDTSSAWERTACSAFGILTTLARGRACSKLLICVAGGALVLLADGRITSVKLGGGAEPASSQTQNAPGQVQLASAPLRKRRSRH